MFEKNKELLELELHNAALTRTVEILRSGTLAPLEDEIETMRNQITRNQVLLELSFDLFWDFYPDQMLTVFSEGYTRHTGWNTRIYADFPKMKRLVHPEDSAMFVEALTAVTNDWQMRFNYEFRWLCSDGYYRWFNNRCFGSKNDKGKLLRIMGMTNNLTPFKKPESALAMPSPNFGASPNSTTHNI